MHETAILLSIQPGKVEQFFFLQFGSLDRFRLEIGIAFEKEAPLESDLC